MAVLTEEQSMLRDAAKSWVQEKSPVTAFRKMRDSGVELGYDAAAWNEMAEMGWAGVIIPEEYGGSNFGYLSPGPDPGGDRPHADRLAAAGLRPGRGLGADAGRLRAQKSRVAAEDRRRRGRRRPGRRRRPAPRAREGRRRRSSGGKLTGKKTFVLEGMAADVFDRLGQGRAARSSSPCVPGRRGGRHPHAPAAGRQPRRGQRRVRQRRGRRRRQAGGRRGRCWRRCSTAPAPASPPRCWAPPPRPSRPRSTT